MNRLNTIVVGTDFSRGARNALAQAIRMSQWNNAALHVVHVLEGSILREVAAARQEPEARVVAAATRRAQRQLHEHLPPAAADRPPQVAAVVGVPIDELLKKVRAVVADLLVLGSAGESGAEPGTGILATKCLRKSPCKVMLVQPRHTGSFRTVVACVDFSEHSHRAIEQALRVASQDGSQVHFLHVFRGPWRRLRYMAPTPEASPEFRKQHLANLQARLREFVGDVAGVNARFKLHEALDCGDGIATFARRVGADLLILGSRGRSNLGYVLLGSTVERLLREVPCSVLAIKL